MVDIPRVGYTQGVYKEGIPRVGYTQGVHTGIYASLHTQGVPTRAICLPTTPPWVHHPPCYTAGHRTTLPVCYAACKERGPWAQKGE